MIARQRALATYVDARRNTARYLQKQRKKTKAVGYQEGLCLAEETLSKHLDWQKERLKNFEKEILEKIGSYAEDVLKHIVKTRIARSKKLFEQRLKQLLNEVGENNVDALELNPKFGRYLNRSCKHNPNLEIGDIALTLESGGKVLSVLEYEFSEISKECAAKWLNVTSSEKEL